MLYTIVVVVRLANAEAKASSLENLGGNQQGIRKNPHVIDAGFGQDLPVNYWCIMWMGISTTPHYEISKQCVETVWRKLHVQKLLGVWAILSQIFDLFKQVV